MPSVKGHSRQPSIGNWELEVGPLISVQEEIVEAQDQFVMADKPNKFSSARPRENSGDLLLELAIGDQTEAIKNVLRLNRAGLNKQEFMSGNTLLHIAAARGNKTLVNFLLEIGARVDIANKKGQTAQDLARDEDIEALIASCAVE